MSERLLTGLVPNIYQALNIVNRKMVGFIPSVTRNANSDRIAKGQTVTSYLTAPASVGDYEQTMAPSEGTRTELGNVQLGIDYYRTTKIPWTGEERFRMDSNGMYGQAVTDLFTEGFEALVTEIEAFLGAMYKKAFMAVGGVGQAFDATRKISSAALIAKYFEDHGARDMAKTLVIGSGTMYNLRSLENLFKVNESGSDAMLRTGVIDPLFGVSIRGSAGIQQHTAGALTGAAVSANYAIGITSIVLDGTISAETIAAGDTITFSSDTTRSYVVKKYTAASHTIELESPGLIKAVADGDTITVAASHEASMAFTPKAIELATRLPKLMQEGDLGTHRIVTDPISGISFDVAYYPGHGMGQFEISVAYGGNVMKPEHLVVLQ